MIPSLNGQCSVIKNGVDIDKFYIKERNRDSSNVGYAGYMNSKKNPMRLAKIIKDHPKKNLVYYSPEAPAGARSLKINLAHIKPNHFNGVVPWSDAQREALTAFYKRYKNR